ncbi:ras-related protein Rab-44 [Tupaia chinensis]|uniref:ras-related protein Rab-44 n=1 Tax=Tupaia chinensis TaxID=246437 RepID=UPI000FFB71D2|nr:ras-related protein Rab-44 [Tupaia chinensis]
MESGQRVSRKGRKLGSSRRRQMREPADGQDAPVVAEPGFWSSQAAAELQGFFQDCGAKERGFVTREDLAEAKFSFLGGKEDPQMIFDWLDVERKGLLSLEEFSSGLQDIFGSSLSSQRLHRKKPLPSKRVSVTTSFPALEEAEAEEKEEFFAFLEQLGTSHLLPEQAEIWQLWGKLRQEEPALAGNLEGFLAKMNSRLREVRADKEALELTLKKRDSAHHHEVQQLYEEMEQQIRREKQQLQAESESRDLALSSRMQEVLEAKEREVQQLAEGQRELEAQLHRLSSTRQEASSENQQLREAERDLAGRLEEVRGQLQVTKGHLSASRARVSWQMEEEPRQVATIPGLGGDQERPGRAGLQTSDLDEKRPGPVPAKPPRLREVFHQDPRITGPGSQEDTALTPGPAEPSQGLEPVALAPMEGLEQDEPGSAVQEGHPGGAGDAHGLVLRPGGLPAVPHQSLEEEGKQLLPGGQNFSPDQSAEAHVEAGRSALPRHHAPSIPLSANTPPAQEEAPAPGKLSPPRASPPIGAQLGAGAGPQEPTKTLPIKAELEARPPPKTMRAEEQAPPQLREPGAEHRPVGPGTDSGEDPTVGKPQADPDYLFHIIFLGDSNVGKTSFLHLLHQNSFAAGLTATVGVDFRIKNLLVDNKCFALQLWDTAGQERWNTLCVQDTGSDGVVLLLLGNKIDCEEERQVPTEAGRQLAQELGVSFGECSAVLGHNILEPMVNMARSLKMQEDRLKGSPVNVAPGRPPKKASCCF